MSWQQVAASRRFLEREQGTVRKDWGGRLPLALVFPNTYYLGMSSLALQTLYRLWNERPDVVCERVFSDLAPPISLETSAPLDHFPIVAFSVSYEMDYFHVASLLRSAGIPPRALDRDDTHPLIIAGGPAVSANPEPLAPLLDAVVIGEVEPILDPLTNALHLLADGRDATLTALSRIPGLYLPNAQEPLSEGRLVSRQWLRDLDAASTHSVLLTPDTEFASMGLIEIARGCGRGCRFCLAGYAYRPPRQRSKENILAQARELLAHGDRLGLVSAAVSDHDDIDQLVRELGVLGARLSVSSMRVDPISEPLLRALAESGARTLTIAPEAGSERLRQVINKTQTEDEVLRAVDLAGLLGIEQIKLYFMLGLPTEDEVDVQSLISLAQASARRFTRRTIVSITPFVPKAHTPFQRVAQTRAKVIKRRLGSVERELRRQGIEVRAESPAWAEIQGTLSRGDRRLAQALLSVERLTPSTWRRALAGAGLDADHLLGERASSEPLPWDFVQGGAQPAYLDRELARANSASTTAACRPKDCVACGVCDGQA